MAHGLTHGNIYGVEIVACSDEKACEIADILCACHTIIRGFASENPEEIIRRFYKDLSDPLSLIGTKGVVYGDDSLKYACLMTQKAYGKQIYENAVCKYYVAHEVYSLHPMDLHPLEDPFKNSYLLSERIRIANVVVNCYAVLEELHTQIKADQKNPSVLPSGEWNPVVKEELCARLDAKHIDPNAKLHWLTRNGNIRPFKTSAVTCTALCEWSDGKKIADFNINVCDAILELSYMRSKLASHKFDKKVLNLTVYDAENAFILARYILLRYFEINFNGQMVPSNV